MNIRKAGVFLSATLSATAVSAASYDASSGYVTMTASDALWSAAASSWTSAGKWSDGRPPHADTNYFVGSGLTIYNGSGAFAGTNLTVAGAVFLNTQWEWRFRNLVLLPGGKIRDYNGVHLNNADSAGESFTVRGTESNPSLWVAEGSAGATKKTFNTSFLGDETSYLRFSVLSSLASRIYTMNSSSYTLTDYPGRFEIGSGIIWEVSWAGESMGGGFVVADGGRLRHVGTANTVKTGSLDVRSGGTLEFNGASTFAVDRKISIAPGSVLLSSFGSEWRAGEPEKRLLFSLGREAVDAGMPDWSQVAVVCTSSGGNKMGPLPRLTNAVELAEDGSAKIYRSYRPVTSMIKNNPWETSALDPRRDPAEFWSDGAFPHAGRDYATYYTLAVHGTAQPYVFPGDSMTLYWASGRLELYDADVTFGELNLSSGAKIYGVYQSGNYHLRGKIHSYMDDGQFGANSLLVGDRIRLNIDADIDGYGDIYVGRHGIPAYSTSLLNASGTLALNGDNSAFSGRIVVGMPDSLTLAGETVLPGPTSNITVEVSSSAALGGACPAFCYDAVTVSNQCRLAVMDDAVFSEATRGWYFPNVAYLKVADGKTVVVSSRITYDATAKLVKEGAGTLALNSVPAAAAGAMLAVSQGALRLDGADVLAGLAVTVSPSARLVLEDDVLPAEGVDLTAENTSLSPAEGCIAVDFMAETMTKAEARNLETVLFKAPNAAAASLAAGLRVTLHASDGTFARRVQVVADEDGATSYVALVSSSGLEVIIR